MRGAPSRSLFYRPSGFSDNCLLIEKNVLGKARAGKAAPASILFEFGS